MRGSLLLASVLLGFGGGARAIAQQDGEVEQRATGDELADELARIRLMLAARRDVAAAVRELDALQRRAASELAGKERFDVLVRVAAARAEIALERGDADAAKAALEHLLPSEVQDEPSRVAEREALDDSRLAALRERIARGVAKPASWQAAELDQDEAAEIAGDPLLLRVHRALEEKDGEFLKTLGTSAVPALVRLTELSVDRVVADPERDPLVALVRIAELRAAEVALAELDAGGTFWRKRVLRAMADQDVLANPGTWDESVTPAVCREPQWIAIVERLCGDPEFVRECLPFLFDSLAHQYASRPMVDALVAALRSKDADLVQATIRTLEALGSSVLEPVCSAVLDHPDAYVRLFAAPKLAALHRPAALLAAADDADPSVRRQVLRCVARLDRQVDEEALRLLERFTADADVDIRREAARELLTKTPLERVAPEVWRRIATDPDEEIRGYAGGYLACPDASLLTELLVPFASDDSPVVRTALDERLAQRAGGLAPEVLLAVMRERMRVARARPELAIPRNTLLNASTQLVGTGVGVDEVARWALEPRDPELLEVIFRAAKSSPAVAQRIAELDPDLLAQLALAADAELGDYRYEQRAAEFLDALGSVGRGAPASFFTAMHARIDAPEGSVVVRLRALQALANGGDPGFASALLDVLRREPEPLERGTNSAYHRAAEDLARASLASTEAWIAVVRDPKTADELALRLLRHFDVEAPGADRLAEAILARWFSTDRPASDAVDTAIWCTSRYPIPIDPELLVRASRVPDYAINAVTAMGKRKDPRFLPALGECVEASWVTDTALRNRIEMQSVWALTQYLSDDAAQVLLSCISKSIPDGVRDACFDAVEKISRYQEEQAKLIARRLGGHKRDEAVARVAELLADPDADVRAEAARAAATLGAVELLPDLIRMLSADEPGVREAARAALDRLNAPAREGG